VLAALAQLGLHKQTAQIPCSPQSPQLGVVLVLAEDTLALRAATAVLAAAAATTMTVTPMGQEYRVKVIEAVTGMTHPLQKAEAEVVAQVL
jgi:hypothetical protein